MKSLVKPPPVACHQQQTQNPPIISAAHLGKFPPVFSSTFGMTIGQNDNNTRQHNVAVATTHHEFSPQALPPLLQIQGNGSLNFSSIGLGERSSQFPLKNLRMASTRSMGLGERLGPIQNEIFSTRHLGMASTTSNIGLGEKSSPMQNNQFSQDSLGMTSTDMVETKLQLDKLEQSRQQLMNMLNDSPMPPRAIPLLNNPPVPPQPRPAAPPRSLPNAMGAPTPLNNYQPTSSAMTLNNNYHPPTSAAVHTSADSNRERDMSEVALACEMMRGDPGLEPRRALELAKHFHNKK